MGETCHDTPLPKFQGIEMMVTGVVPHVPAFFYWDVTNHFLNCCIDLVSV